MSSLTGSNRFSANITTRTALDTQYLITRIILSVFFSSLHKNSRLSFRPLEILLFNFQRLLADLLSTDVLLRERRAIICSRCFLIILSASPSISYSVFPLDNCKFLGRTRGREWKTRATLWWFWGFEREFRDITTHWRAKRAPVESLRELLSLPG